MRTRRPPSRTAWNSPRPGRTSWMSAGSRPDPGPRPSMWARSAGASCPWSARSPARASPFRSIRAARRCSAPHAPRGPASSTTSRDCPTPRCPGLVAAAGAGAVIVHMRGEPATMQEAPRYRDVVGEVLAHLAGRVAECRAAGIPAERLAVDPGYGFGKNLHHNLALMRGLGRFGTLGCTVALGVSRKASLGRMSGEASARAPTAGIDRGRTCSQLTAACGSCVSMTSPRPVAPSWSGGP